MCGIAGFTWKDEALVARMAQALAHRGPDQHGLYTDNFVSLGHRRLSIIDLSEHGRQPMSNEDGSVWVTYNGEIYNFAEIRRNLEARGHVFRSRTDTEVIVHAYEEYGPDCVQRFNGMFAFAVWDRRKRELFLARDRLGIKPLYYGRINGRLIFSSEIKAILEHPDLERKVNPMALYRYIGYEFVPAPDTIFRNVQKLPAGHYLLFKDGKERVVRYWDLHFDNERKPPSFYEERMRELLADSVDKRLISDVPLGAFLSGGLDSSAVVALMSRSGVDPIRTFSIGYDDPTFSELDYARLISRQFKTERHELIIDPVTPELIEEAVWHLDEPMTDLSTIPLYLICREARKHVKVCLSGEGGDEVLVGYDRFKASKANSYYAVLPDWFRRGVVGNMVRGMPDRPQKKGVINILKRFIEGGLLPEDGGHLRWQYFGNSEHDSRLFSEAVGSQMAMDPFSPVREHLALCNSSQRLDREVYADLKFVMPESVLMKVDKMSMAHALEIRVPFLDHRFVEFCATIPPHMKLRGFTTKALFRSAMKGIIPDAVLNRGKQGYSLPIKNWLRHEMKDYMQGILGESPLMKDAFNMNYINGLMREHLEYRANHNHILWALINLAVWHRLFVENRDRPAPVSDSEGTNNLANHSIPSRHAEGHSKA